MSSSINESRTDGSLISALLSVIGVKLLVPCSDGLVERYSGQCLSDELAILYENGNFREVELRKIIPATLCIFYLCGGVKKLIKDQSDKDLVYLYEHCRIISRRDP